MPMLLALSTKSGLIGLVILILDIIAIVDILTGRKHIVNKLLWILLVLILPLIGMVIYFLFGRD